MPQTLRASHPEVRDAWLRRHAADARAARICAECGAAAELVVVLVLPDTLARVDLPACDPCAAGIDDANRSRRAGVDPVVRIVELEARDA